MLIRTRALFVAVIVVSAFFACGNVLAQGTLTGSGDHLPLPSSPYYAGQMPAYLMPTIGSNTGSSFTGTWANPADPQWVGTFTATGPVPSNSAGPCTTVYDFSGVGNGYIPAGTFLIFDDIDEGAGHAENFALGASLGMVQCATPWASLCVGTTGYGATDINAMPSYQWDGSINNQCYRFDGTSVERDFADNPNVTFVLLTLQPITGMEVIKNDTNFGFSLGAPVVPEPSTLIMLGGALLGLLGYAWRRRRAS